MSRFDKYFLMKEKDIPDFVREKTSGFFDENAVFSVKEIGDGNINYVFHTTDAVMDHKEKKALVKAFINPELCEITEDLVLTEPYNDIKKRNIIIPENAEFVRRELYEDKKLHLKIAELKFDFMNNTQALIHGDLHTGSVFVKEKAEGGRAATRIFDPEFAFFGPIGYDVGNIIANLFFAWDNGKASGDDSFCAWITAAASSVIDLFKEKFLSAFNEKAAEIMAKTEGFAGFYLDGIIADTAAYTGTELIRRTVGMAPVKDLTAIGDEKKRSQVSRVNIIAAKKFIFNQRNMHSGKDFIGVFLDSAKEAGL